MKTCEFETKIEIAGRVMPASIVYTYDPDDGWLIISSVKAYVVKESRYDAAGKWLDSPEITRIEVNQTPIMDEYQLHSFASEIHDALNADRNALRIEQMELRRAERAA